MKNLTTIILSLLLLVSCGSNNTKTETQDITRSGDTIQVSRSSLLFSKLKVAEISEQDYRPRFNTVGTVRPAAGCLAEISVPADGRTTRAYVRLGDKVRAGQPLFGFHSADFAEYAKQYFEAKSNNDLALRNLDRKRKLKESGIASERELEEAQNNAEVSMRELRQAVNTLRVIGVDAKKLQSGGSFDICSPIDGEVVSCEVVNGQFVKSDSDPIVEVADLKRVWIRAMVKEKYIGFVSAEDSVLVRLDNASSTLLPGRVYYIGQMVDEETRSVEVIVECDNRKRQMKPGMFVRTDFFSRPVKAILIPSEALLQANESAYVLVQKGEGLFVKRPVTVESCDNGSVRVLSGLNVGERIITDGAIYLSE